MNLAKVAQLILKKDQIEKDTSSYSKVTLSVSEVVTCFLQLHQEGDGKVIDKDADKESLIRMIVYLQHRMDFRSLANVLI